MLRYATLVFFACTAVGQDCRQSADPKQLLSELADLSRDRTPSDEAFHHVLPCTPEVVPLQTLLDALQYELTASQKKTIIGYFHIQSPIGVEDVDAISRSSLPGELIDEMLLPIENGDLKLDSNPFHLKADVLARLAQKHVSEETLLRLGAVYRIGGDVSHPIKLDTPQPGYSEAARKAKYSGSVLLSVVIDKDGNTRDIRVIKPLGYGLDEKAIEAVTNWRFRPAMKDGHPVAVQANIEVNFHLLDNPPRDGAAKK